MTAEVTPAAIALLMLLLALFLHDFLSFESNRRLLVVQGAVFAVGATLIVFPEIARRLAHSVGIGRGVDFVLYPLVIWLVRESLLSRRRRHAVEARITELVRSVAMSGAHVAGEAHGASAPAEPAVPAAPTRRAPAQSSGSSAS